MEVHDEYLPEEQYAEFVAHMPEVCVEVVLERDGAVLLARRTNEPAKGEWFWPGSRLYKGETTTGAARRVGREELGVDVEVEELLGVHPHFWDRSAQSSDVSRHTVNVVFRVTPASDDSRPALDDQHSDHRWLSGPEPDLHEYVDRYFERFDIPRN